MKNARLTNDKIKKFYQERAAIELEYANRLGNLSHIELDTYEIGTMKQSLEMLQSETSVMAKAHAANATQLQADLIHDYTKFSDEFTDQVRRVRLFL